MDGGLSFRIVRWMAAAPGLAGEEAWRRWARGEARVKPGEPALAARSLPAMLRRRLSPGALLAAECARAAAAGAAPGLLVFASRNAELPRSEKLLAAIARSEDVSPTDFAMSVHNTAAGVYTIAGGIRTPHTSVAACADTFSAGLAEACAALAEGAGEVLAVFYENALPEILGPTIGQAGGEFPWSAAFLLAPGASLSASASPRAFREPTEEPALQFLRGWLRGEERFCVSCGRADWHWSAK